VRNRAHLELLPIAKLAEADLTPPVDALDRAIKDESRAGFKNAYDSGFPDHNLQSRCPQDGFSSVARCPHASV
jgi:hypothetical protein